MRKKNNKEHPQPVPTKFRQPGIKETFVEASPPFHEETTDKFEISPIVEDVLRASREEKKPCFILVLGQEVGRIMPLTRRRIIIGRDPTCDEVIAGQGVSRQHAEVIQIDANTFQIRDLNSTNGIYVSGKRIRETILKDGDKILLGRQILLKFVFQDQIDDNYGKEMYHASTRDVLTGTYNRKYLMEKIVTDLSFAHRHALPYTFVLFDIDHFKKINDTYGHQIGDRVLVSLADAVSTAIRTEDLIARYGGEEFAITAPATDVEGGVVLGERVRQCVADKPMRVMSENGAPLHITVSVGLVTVLPTAVTDAAGIISIADDNLYEAKRTGRNRVVTSHIE
ncbi:MAG: GGDEF domain-containing protein [Myxococcota bacterium]|nr:GGDEF domain-containing protein [Myxococcota bacterium]